MSNNSKIKFLKIVTASFVGIVITLLVVVLCFSIINDKYCDVAYNGVKINNIDVSFKNKNEIIEIINDTVIPNMSKSKIKII